MANKTTSKEIATKYTKNGCLDYEHALSVMTKEEKQEYLAMASKLDINDINSIQSYGQDLSKTISTTGDALLQQVSADPTIEVVALANELLNDIKGFDVDVLNRVGEDGKEKSGLARFFGRLSIVKKVTNKVDSYMTQYRNVKDNVDKVAGKLMQSKMVAKRDNGTLEEMFVANDSYVRELRDLILSAKLKQQEAQARVDEMMAHPEDYDLVEIQDAQTFVNSLSKKISNFIVTEHSLTQTKLQIRATQANNNEIIQKSDEIVTQILPLWKNQLAIAITTYNQKASIETQKRVGETTDEMLIISAKNLHVNSVEAAKNAERPVISTEALKTVQQELFQTIDDVQALHDQGELDRQEIERTISEFKKQLYEKISK